MFIYYKNFLFILYIIKIVIHEFISYLNMIEFLFAIKLNMKKINACIFS